MQVGSLVRLKIPCLGNPKGTVGFCYEVYAPRGYYLDRPHCSIIFPNSNYDGFSVDEQNEFLEYVGESGLQYTFTNVIRLSQDFYRGLFTPYFTIPSRRSLE
jgi:hypothetical protein